MPGHEVVARVSAVGTTVAEHRVGDGVGPIVGSCGRCPSCREGVGQYCTGPTSCTHAYNGPMVADGTTTYGGYSARVVVAEPYVFAVPAGLDLTGVPPVLCAGLTTGSPLTHWRAVPTGPARRERPHTRPRPGPASSVRTLRAGGRGRASP